MGATVRAPGAPFVTNPAGGSGTVIGTGTPPEIAVWAGAGALQGFPDLLWDDALAELLAGPAPGALVNVAPNGLWLLGRPTVIDGSAAGAMTEIAILGSGFTLDYSTGGSIANGTLIAPGAGVDASQGSTVDGFFLGGGGYTFDASQGSSVINCAVLAYAGTIDVSQAATVEGLSVLGYQHTVSLAAGVFTNSWVYGSVGTLAHHAAGVLSAGDQFGGISSQGDRTLALGVGTGLAGIGAIAVLGNNAMALDISGVTAPLTAGQLRLCARPGSGADLIVTNGQVEVPTGGNLIVTDAASGTFTTVDLKTVTVVSGIVTSIV